MRGCYRARMPTPDFILRLREHVGHDLLWLAGATAVILDDDRVLLVRRADTGAWTPVTGIVDPGEHPATTAVREALEEAGVVVEVEALVRVHVIPPRTYVNGDSAHYLDHVLRCRYVSGDAHVADEESVDVGWFPLDALPPMSDRMLARIDAAVSFDGTVDLDGAEGVASPGARDDVATIPRDHYRQLLLAAGQDLAEASATEIATTGAFGGPGPSATMLVADAFAVEPAAATELVEAYLETLRHRCAERGVSAPSLDDVMSGIARGHHPRCHARIDVDALAEHLRATVAPQTIAMHPRHRAAVLDGSKTVTVRWREPIAPGPATLTFDGDERVRVRVRSVERVALAGVSPAAVHAEPGTDMREYVDLLRSRHYPGMPVDAILDVVVFALDAEPSP